MADTTPEPVRVAFIGGTGRSGSTLVARSLGSAPGLCSVGELCWLWSYGLIRDRPCGCGQPFSSCPFWTAVGDHAYDGWHNVEAERASDLRRTLQRNRNVPALWRGGGSLADDLAEYGALMEALYDAIRVVSGAPIVVDNSKQVGAALVARSVPGVDLRVIHLIRRSHGVAHSWTKHVARSDMGGSEMRRRTPGRTALKWVVDNALFEALGTGGTARLAVRYEDFVDQPGPELSRMLDFLDAPDHPDRLSFVDDLDVTLATDHSVWGNPMRLQTGPVRVRPDHGWRTGMSDRDRRVVTALSMPGLVRHGYVPDDSDEG